MQSRNVVEREPRGQLIQVNIDILVTIPVTVQVHLLLCDEGADHDRKWCGTKFCASDGEFGALEMHVSLGVLEIQIHFYHTRAVIMYMCVCTSISLWISNVRNMIYTFSPLLIGISTRMGALLFGLLPMKATST